MTSLLLAPYFRAFENVGGKYRVLATVLLIYSEVEGHLCNLEGKEMPVGKSEEKFGRYFW